MQTIKQPYELLIRWSQDGTLAGAHVQHRYITTDGGVIVGEFVGSAEPLTLETAAGYPLGDVLTQAQSDAVAAVAAANADKESALARVAELEAQLAALQSAQG